jgi:PAS domain S-box-containing protein
MLWKFPPITTRPLAAYLAIFLFFCVLPQSVGEEAGLKAIRRVLILNEVNTSFPGIPLIDGGIRLALTTSPYQLEVYREYMDTVYFPDAADQERIRDFYIRKYQDRRPDVIITVGPSPLKFMEEKHQVAFPGVPIVFCLPQMVPGTLTLDPDFTGVENDLAPRETVNAALRLQPDTKHVVVVGGTSANDKQVERVVRDRLRTYEGNFDVSYLTTETMPNLLERLRHLPEHTIILYIGFGQDAAGTKFISGSEASTLIVAAANAPVFSLFDVHLNHGEVGGKVSYLQEQGRMAGGLAMRVLNGEKPQNIPRAKAGTVYLFDWRALKRWGLKESHLPPEHILLNSQPTAWELYKWYIIGGISLILLETLLIGGLLWQRARRRQAETELSLTYDRLRQAVEAGHSVGWDWDIKTGQQRSCGDLQTLFGIRSETICGGVDDLDRYVHPDDRERVWKAVADTRKNREPYVAEFRVIRADGALHWIAARGSFQYASNGDPERMLGMAVDITDRRRAEELWFRLAAIVESSQDAIISQNFDSIILTWNQGAQRIFEYTEAEAVGQSINLIVPPELWHEEEEIREKLRTNGRIEQRETTRITKTGRKIDVSLSISMIKDASGNVVSLSVIAQDITERRQAEKALRESEQRFRLVANTAPVMIWMSGQDRLRNYFNQSWLEFTGRPLQTELGDGWTETVHPEDLQRCLDRYTSAFDCRETFKMQYRMRRHDGEYRWVLDIGVPRLAENCSFEGYIGSCIDITERRLAEEALSSISRRLIEAQEQERAWIARELHDDINQRMALLAIQLDKLKKPSSDSPGEMGRHLDGLRLILLEISKDVQGLSHRLHSSKLEYLGLTIACRGFCNEVAERHKVRVNFSADGIPDKVSPDVSICLFRVLQESLNNAIKYSGTEHFEVKLRRISNEIQLVVRDNGTGFDVETAMNSQGLGLISMRERVSLVNGKMAIVSNPTRGTEITVHVPLVLATGTNEMRLGAA